MAPRRIIISEEYVLATFFLSFFHFKFAHRVQVNPTLLHIIQPNDNNNGVLKNCVKQKEKENKKLNWVSLKQNDCFSLQVKFVTSLRVIMSHLPNEKSTQAEAKTEQKECACACTLKTTAKIKIGWDFSF